MTGRCLLHHQKVIERSTRQQYDGQRNGQKKQPSAPRLALLRSQQVGIDLQQILQQQIDVI